MCTLCLIYRTYKSKGLPVSVKVLLLASFMLLIVKLRLQLRPLFHYHFSTAYKHQFNLINNIYRKLTMAARSLCHGCLAQRMMMIIRQRPVVSTYKNSLPYSTSSKQSKYVLDRVRTHDYENYLVCLLSPKQYR